MLHVTNWEGPSGIRCLTPHLPCTRNALADPDALLRYGLKFVAPRLAAVWPVATRCKLNQNTCHFIRFAAAI